MTRGEARVTEAAWASTTPPRFRVGAEVSTGISTEVDARAMPRRGMEGGVGGSVPIAVSLPPPGRQPSGGIKS